MKRDERPRRRYPLLAIAVVVAACARAKAPAPAEVPPPPPPAPPPLQAVSAVVVANDCARLGKANAKMAEAAMNQLVDGCGSFKGEPVRFIAQLLPDGSIQFQPGPPGPGQGAPIPICVLEHPLKHRVKLQAACSLDVRLEQTSVAAPHAADGGADGASDGASQP